MAPNPSLEIGGDLLAETRDMNDNLLDAARAWAAENAPRIGLQPTASIDLARRLLAIGVLARKADGSIYAQAGGTLEDLVELVRSDQASRHLFVHEAPTKAPSSGPNPATMTAANRLAFANGGNAKASL